MTLIELKKALIEKMKTKYPESTYRYYGIEVVEGYQKPSFFTQLKPITLDFSNRNSTENVLTFYITYFQKEINEADMLRKVDELRELFGQYLMVGKRAVDISNFDFDYAGNDKNILEISFDLEFFGKIETKNTAPTITEVETKVEMEE